eukprot:SAG31_NODE_56_length_29726_cov_41.443312_18_plen_79_part_00
MGRYTGTVYKVYILGITIRINPGHKFSICVADVLVRPPAENLKGRSDPKAVKARKAVSSSDPAVRILQSCPYPTIVRY